MAILSDIHANLVALDRVLREAEKKEVDGFWCVGDVVGYGPRPLQCWQRLRELGIPVSGWVAGNHDWGLVGKLDARVFRLSLIGEGPDVLAGDFSDSAWRTILQQRKALRYPSSLLEHLESLPVLGSPVAGVYLTHGTFDKDPHRCVTLYSRAKSAAESSFQFLQVEWARLHDPGAFPGLSREAAQSWHTPRLLVVGHTHVPCVWQRSQGTRENGARWKRVMAEDLHQLDTQPAFLSPGSVGFPRDSDPGLVSFAVLEWDGGEAEMIEEAKIEICRVAYSKEETIRQMKDVGVDADFVSRLFD